MTETVDWSNLRRESLKHSLRRHVQGEVHFDASSRALYSTDASPYRIEPIGVVIPRTPADVVAAASVAMEQRIPIVPRGAGTSLSGQAIGPGLVIDFAKYLCRILETNLQQGWVRVEPGVVLEQLNNHLAPMGFQFGPDVATIDRATLGGMIGNNSAGAHSIKYGKTVDHVLSLDVFLTDNRLTTFGPIRQAELEVLSKREDREGEIYRTVKQILGKHEGEIRRRFPKVLRRVSGYNLDALLGPDPPNLSKLIVGSEGTLAIVTAATLKIVPRPSFRGVAAVHFQSLQEALRSLSGVLSTGPSATELIDRMILDLARQSTEYRKRIDFVQGRPDALFVVEYTGEEPDEIDRRFEQLRDVLAEHKTEAIVATREPELCQQIWNIRKMALPLLLSLPGNRKPVTFVEDTAVDPSRLPEFTARFHQILEKHGTSGSYYGHASVGCLHIRPLLDLRSLKGREQMTAIAEEVLELVLEFGGSMSGEHGDGLVRSVHNRKLFGEEIYEAFRSIKKAFDPENLLNPGKIVDGPDPTENLRDHPEKDPVISTLFSFEQDGGILEVARRCNGNALCRREGIGTMCPSYMATRAEQHSPRGRANLLHAALTGKLSSGNSWASKELDEALDLCLMCKACKTECPSSVDVAKMKSEYLYQSFERRQPSRLDTLMANLPRSSRLGCRFAPFSNWVLRSWPTRWMMHWMLGIDRRRKLPAFRRQTLEKWFARHESLCRKTRGRVVLLADCFTNFHQPQIGMDAIRLIERAGYQVFLAPICCGRVLISKGFLDQARDLVTQNVDRLLSCVEDGWPILGIEPSCLFTLADEWRDLVPGEATTLISRQVHQVETWLAERSTTGASDLPPSNEEPLAVLVHGHCHQKVAGAFDESLKAMRNLASIEPKVLDAGCCGMAGSFGYETAHYELSLAIAEERLLPAIRSSSHMPIVASGFSCRTQISDLTGQRPLHPIEMIHRRIMNDES